MQTSANIDWKQAPKEARWWSMYANSQAHWFCKPNVQAFTDFWFLEPILAPSFGCTGDWKVSLVERPVS